MKITLVLSILLALLGVLVLIDLSQIPCSQSEVLGIDIKVVDSGNGEATVAGLNGVLHHRDYIEELKRLNRRNYLRVIGAIERPGTYQVKVVAPGYLSWSQERVEMKIVQAYRKTSGYAPLTRPKELSIKRRGGPITSHPY